MATRRTIDRCRFCSIHPLRAPPSGSSGSDHRYLWKAQPLPDREPNAFTDHVVNDENRHHETGERGPLERLGNSTNVGRPTSRCGLKMCPGSCVCSCRSRTSLSLQRSRGCFHTGGTDSGALYAIKRLHSLTSHVQRSVGPCSHPCTAPLIFNAALHHESLDQDSPSSSSHEDVSCNLPSVADT